LMRRRTKRLLQNDSIPDEEEQEEIIEELRYDNQMATKSFKFVIALLSVCTTIPMAFLIQRRNILQHILGITSLLMTAFMLQYLPEEAPTALHGPLARYSSPLNGLLVILVLLLAYSKAESGRPVIEVAQSLSIIPLIMHFIATMIRRSAAQTASELEALERQKYTLKGV
jgi:hypothetical protein